MYMYIDIPISLSLSREKMFKLEKEVEILRRRVASNESASVKNTSDSDQVEELRLELADKR